MTGLYPVGFWSDCFDRLFFLAEGDCVTLVIAMQVQRCVHLLVVDWTKDSLNWPLHVQWSFQFGCSLWLASLQKETTQPNTSKYVCVCVCVCVCIRVCAYCRRRMLCFPLNDGMNFGGSC